MKPYYIAEAVIFLLAVLFFAIVFLLPVWVVTLVFPTKSVYVVCIGGFLAIAAAARLSLLGSRLSGGSQAFKKLQAESRNRGRCMNKPRESSQSHWLMPSGMA
ncbi:MAG: hypothetical protein HZC36_03285 [Armatimonadetes bacterium]|nr:hypothetical protein [Armatimonadota bacterium]